jgi:hypothetical protein
VPPIGSFLGIVIEMYFGDHPLPHFHARYIGESAKIEIATESGSPGRSQIGLRVVRAFSRVN